MSDKQNLRTWCVTSPRRDWDKVVVCAYSMKDAIQLYVEVGGGERGATNLFQNYSTLGGTPFQKLAPNPCRGCYFVDRHYKSVMYVEPKSRSIVDDVPAEAKVAAAAAPAPEEYGSLRVGFTRGVKVDTWKYHSPFGDRAHADLMTAEVRMQNASKRGRDAGKDGIEFVATSKCFEDLRSPNIESLFSQVQEAFRTYDLAQRGIVWEDWLEVEIEPSSGWRKEKAAGFKVGYRRLKRGVDPRNGNVYTLSDSGSGAVIPFPKPKAAGEVRTKKVGRFEMADREEENQYAYLPATKANIAALDAVIHAINNARAKLEMILVQDKIEHTLASIPTVPLLESKEEV